MKAMQRVRQIMHDPLSTFKYFERTVVAVCISLPLILRLADFDPGTCLPCEAWKSGFRWCISDYAYILHNYYFGMMFTIAAMLFMVNGVVYFRSERTLQLSRHGTWYNFILGLSLLGVVLFPYKQHLIPHCGFAIVFFAGNAIVPVLFGKKKNRPAGIVLAVLALIGFIIYWVRPAMLSLLWAEWISLAVIGIHFILEARDKPAPVLYLKRV